MSTSASEKVTLDHEMTINGTCYPVGTNEVPTEVAPDLRRMNSQYNESMRKLNVGHRHMSDAGSIAMGSGAE